ncbi:MAG: LamG domain-containing protein, partial [Patescibacteria group bacterium]|nr:LamG domain-containing protein [Patescibacteria group bacterium]
STAASDGGPDPTAYELGSNLSITPFIHGLVGYWPLNEGSGTTAYDNSGWNNNGTLEGATDLPTWTTTGCLSHGSCLSFDGSDDYVESNTANGIGNSTVSECLWASFNNFNNENQLGYIENTANSRYFYLSTWCSSGSPYSCVHLNNGSQGEVSGRIFNTSSWYFVCGVIDMKNGVISTYINGSPLQSTSFSPGTLSGTPASIWTGGTAEGYQHMAGLINNTRFYDTALTASQIQAIYNAEKPQ